jgi:DNA topoisomerase I
VNIKMDKHKNLRIIRSKKGNGFQYTDRKTKKKIRNKKILDHITKMVIPPAYPKVYISDNPNNRVQAIGIDNKGRDQYFYHQDAINERKEHKFNGLIDFIRKIPKIRNDMFRVIMACKPNERKFSKKEITCMVLFLMDRCNFRVGCQKYKDIYDSFGATTLMPEHLDIKSKSIIIQFKGKKGVLNQSEVTHPKMVELLKHLLKQTSPNHYLFTYYQHPTDSREYERAGTYTICEKHINQYLKSYHPNISCKMYRTYSANYECIKKLNSVEVESAPAHRKRIVLQILRDIADKHHHTVTVSRSSYLHEGIIAEYLDDPEKWKNEFIKNGKTPDKFLIYMIRK